MSVIQQLIQDFNDELIHFAKSMSELVPNSTLSNNLDYLEHLTKNKPKFIIDQFVIHVLKYKEQIDNHKEEFFLGDEFSKELDETVDKSLEEKKNNGEAVDKKNIMSKIFDFTEIWRTLSKENKEGIFTTMSVLCYYCEEYFMKAFG